MPLVGVLFLGWELGTIMVLFWAENVVIGVFAILRVALVARWAGLFLVPFFTFHYGIFTTVHGVFVFTLFASDLGVADLTRVILPAVAALIVSHAVSFVTHFLLGGERAAILARKEAPNSLMFAPYRRIIVMHITILGGGFLIGYLGSPVWALALLVVLKTAMDLRAHVNERERAAAPPPTVEPQTTA